MTHNPHFTNNPPGAATVFIISCHGRELRAVRTATTNESLG